MKQFVITIARGYGSGGRTMGKMLAERLGVPYYDRELLKLASNESGIHESYFENADEKVKHTMLYKIARNVYKGELIPADREDFISNENLFNYQAKVIKEIADRGSCVIIGRCADYILKDNPNVIRLYVHAPMATCIEAVKDIVPTDNVERYIETIDKRRAAYYRYFTGRDWKDAANYDLCLNSSQLGYEKCIELVKAYLAIKEDEN